VTDPALLADLVLLAHLAVVLFAVLGQMLVLIGGPLGWPLVRRTGLRVAHLGLVLFVAVQSWLGAVCPLTSIEQALRRAAGEPVAEASFVEQWVTRLLFYEAPWWVFVAAYTAFAALVAASWWRWPPRRRWRDRRVTAA